MQFDDHAGWDELVARNGVDEQRFGRHVAVGVKGIGTSCPCERRRLELGYQVFRGGPGVYGLLDHEEPVVGCPCSFGWYGLELGFEGLDKGGGDRRFGEAVEHGEDVDAVGSTV